MRLYRTVAFFGICIVMAFAGCRQDGNQQEGATMHHRDVSAVMNDHAAEMMALPGVVGVAVSETDDHMPCILVMIAGESDSLRRRLPATIEGIPIRIEVTGEIVPFDSSEG